MKSRNAESTGPYLLKIESPMTFACRQQLEQTIIYAMRCHTNLEADLSGVEEIDLYGIHLLGLLQRVGAVIAISPTIEEASRRLLTSYRGAYLGRIARAESSTFSQ